MTTFFERHPAVVADTNDPDQRFRIKVKCAALTGNEDNVYPDWLEPKIAWGFVLLPDVGEQVEAEWAASSSRDEAPGQTFMISPQVYWTGNRFFSPTVTPDEMFTTNYGKRRGFCTPGGHVLAFDDTESARKINLVWHSGDSTYSMFSIDEDGSIILINQNGAMIYLNAASKQFAAIDEFGNSITMDINGIRLVDKSSNIIEMKGGTTPTIQILSQSAVTLSCKDAVINAGKVQLGDQGLLPTDGLLNGLSLDPFTGLTHFVLGNASMKIFGQKI
jgi:hypothetical protein